MPKGDNKVTINFTTEMKQFGDSKKGDLYLSFFTALAFLQYYKDEFIAKYGQEKYDEHIKRYSIPAVEVRNNSVTRKKDALAQKRRELELREKELEIKTKFMQAETTAMQDKHETKEEQERLKNPDYMALVKAKKSAEDSIRYYENKPKLEDYEKANLERNRTELAEVKQKLKNFKPQ